MAFIDLVRWTPNGANIYAWRFPHTNLSTMTQLIVQESQEAVLFSKGQMVGKFGPGKHTLTTENMPLLRSLYGIPFGGKNPFTAEVWFVNKVQAYNLEWHTDTIPVHDACYNTHIPLYARGQYGLKVVDTEKFLIKAVGTKTEFTEGDLTNQFAGEFISKVKSIVLQYMVGNNLGFKQISMHLSAMSDLLKKEMGEFWAELGIELTKFYVNTIDIDCSSDVGRRIKEAITQQAEMHITGRTWQQEQMFDTANNAINGITSSMSSSGNGGLLGGLLAINMINNSGRNGGSFIPDSMTTPVNNGPTFGGIQTPGGANQPVAGGGANTTQSVKMVHCSNCAHRFPNTSRFCPNCGDVYNPCPNCGTDNDLEARRCISCGIMLNGSSGAVNTCPNCNQPLAPGVSFCSSCGRRLVPSNVCSRCGAPLSPKSAFCSNCGLKNA